MVLNHLYLSSVYSAKGTSLAMLRITQSKVSARKAMLRELKEILPLPGCMRDPAWPWWMQPLPWWTLFLLVPIYSICSSLSNLQYWRSLQLPIMVLFSCCAYAANHAASLVLPGRTDIVSAAGAFVIGSLGNVYSRVVRGTAFTSMVTGVLFLVPVSALVFHVIQRQTTCQFIFKSGIAQGGGLTQTYHSSAEQYSSGFSLALRMISVAAGVTIGLFVSQVIGVFVLLAFSNGHLHSLSSPHPSIFIWKPQKCRPFRFLKPCLFVFLSIQHRADCIM